MKYHKEKEITKEHESVEKKRRKNKIIKKETLKYYKEKENTNEQEDDEEKRRKNNIIKKKKRR